MWVWVDGRVFSSVVPTKVFDTVNIDTTCCTSYCSSLSYHCLWWWACDDLLKDQASRMTRSLFSAT